MQPGTRQRNNEEVIVNKTLIRGFAIISEDFDSFLDRHLQWCPFAAQGTSKWWVHPPETLGSLLAQSKDWSIRPRRLYAAVHDSGFGTLLLDSQEIWARGPLEIAQHEAWLASQLAPTQEPDWKFLEDRQVIKYGITIAAIHRRAGEMGSTVAMTDEDQERAAANYLCTVCEEMSRYGGMVTYWT